MELVGRPSLSAQRSAPGAGFGQQYILEQLLLSIQRELGWAPVAPFRGARRHAGGAILHTLSRLQKLDRCVDLSRSRKPNRPDRLRGCGNLFFEGHSTLQTWRRSEQADDVTRGLSEDRS